MQSRPARSRQRHKVELVPVLGAMILSACGTSSRLRPQPMGDDHVAWRACPAELGHPPDIECAVVEVPLDWSAPDGAAIAVFARRLRVPNSRGQLWAFDGGPGAAGDGFLTDRFLRLARALRLDLYVPTHRGVAYGTPLSCPKAQAATSPAAQRVADSEWPGCVAELRARWGASLRAFNSRQAARDVEHLMAGSPGTGRRVMFAGSYGTWWAQRVLQRGATADLVVLDSGIDLAEDVARQDFIADTAGRRLLAQCQDSACARLAGGGITAVATRVFDELRAGTGCGDDGGPSIDEARALLALWLDGDPAARALIAPWLARMDRCSADDKLAVTAARARLHFTTSGGRAMPSQARFNPVFNKHLVSLELYDYARPREQLAADVDAAWFGFGASLSLADIAASFGADWALEPSVELPTTAANIIVFHGRLDPRGLPAWAERVAARWRAAGATVDLVMYDSSGHSTPRYTAIGDTSCSERLIAAKLDALDEPLDLACVSKAPGIDFAGTTNASIAAATSWFGTPDVWGGLLLGTLPGSRGHSPARKTPAVSDLFRRSAIFLTGLSPLRAAETISHHGRKTGAAATILSAGSVPKVRDAPVRARHAR